MCVSEVQGSWLMLEAQIKFCFIKINSPLLIVFNKTHFSLMRNVGIYCLFSFINISVSTFLVPCKIIVFSPQ